MYEHGYETGDEHIQHLAKRVRHYLIEQKKQKKLIMIILFPRCS